MSRAAACVPLGLLFVLAITLGAWAPAPAQPAPAQPAPAQPAPADPAAEDPNAGPAPTEAELAKASPIAPPTITLGQSLERALPGIPDILRSGIRAQAIRDTQTVIPVVVVVERPEMAAMLISTWRGQLRFPILIDDFSFEATENVGRFVRAFKPLQVYRWYIERGRLMPEDPGEAFSSIVKFLSQTAGLDPTDDQGAYVAELAKYKLKPQGVVGVDPRDPAWIGGLALAAGRYQLLTHIDAKAGGRGGLSATVDPGRIEALDAQLSLTAERHGLSWDAIGDDVDAITIAASYPSRVEAQGGALATTDALGRRPDDPGQRWAHAGILHGDAQASLYRAMCALFLAPSSAWLFDGYPDEGNWTAFDMGPAGPILEQMGLSVDLLDTPRNSLAHWQGSITAGLKAGLVMVNSKGNPTWFDLEPGRATAGDVPIMHTPGVVLFTHSFSAATPDNRNTIAGRWLENGAYAYVGSVHEPFLSAFVPPREVAARAAAGASLGAIVRQPSGPVWKLNLFGDPLITLRGPSTAGQRARSTKLPVGGMKRVEREITAWIYAENNLREALRQLTLEARDFHAAELASGLVARDHPQADHEFAKWGIMPLARENRPADLLRVAARLDPEKAADTPLADAIWHAAPRLVGDETLPLVQTLTGFVRPKQRTDDAIRLAEIINTRTGLRDAQAYLDTVIAQTTDERARDRLTKARDGLAKAK